MADRQTSFMRSLCMGDIEEAVLLPFPEIPAKDVETLRQVIASLEQLLGPKEKDFRAWDVAGELPATVVASEDRVLAFLDISPATRGHTLVIPRVHAQDIHEIGLEDLAASVALAQRIAGRARERLGADGVNLLHSSGQAAWQTVFHFHIHVIPRYAGDPLRLPWLPAPGDPAEIAAAGAALAGE